MQSAAERERKESCSKCVCVEVCVDIGLAVCICAVLTRVDRGCEHVCVVQTCMCCFPRVVDPSRGPGFLGA